MMNNSNNFYRTSTVSDYASVASSFITPKSSRTTFLETPQSISRCTISSESDPIVSSGFRSKSISRPKNFYICLSNISWELLGKDVCEWLSPLVSVDPDQVFIVMDRTAINGRQPGKTFGEAFIELKSSDDAIEVVDKLNKTWLKGRVVNLRLSSEEELMKYLFPIWGGNQFSTNSKHVYLEREEISNLLIVCRNYKMHYSRKCADRPFENIIYIIRKIKWMKEDSCPSQMHRDHLFEMLKVSIEILKYHLNKDYKHVSPDLLQRMMVCGIKCSGFTLRQKQVLIQITGLKCPPHLEWLLEPNTMESNTSLSLSFEKLNITEGPNFFNSSPISQKDVLDYCDIINEENIYKSSITSLQQELYELKSKYENLKSEMMNSIQRRLNSEFAFLNNKAISELKKLLENNKDNKHVYEEILKLIQESTDIHMKDKLLKLLVHGKQHINNEKLRKDLIYLKLNSKHYYSVLFQFLNESQEYFGLCSSSHTAQHPILLHEFDISCVLDGVIEAFFACELKYNLVESLIIHLLFARARSYEGLTLIRKLLCLDMFKTEIISTLLDLESFLIASCKIDVWELIIENLEQNHDKSLLILLNSVLSNNDDSMEVLLINYLPTLAPELSQELVSVSYYFICLILTSKEYMVLDLRLELMQLLNYLGSLIHEYEDIKKSALIPFLYYKYENSESNDREIDQLYHSIFQSLESCKPNKNLSKIYEKVHETVIVIQKRLPFIDDFLSSLENIDHCVNGSIFMLLFPVLCEPDINNFILFIQRIPTTYMVHAFCFLSYTLEQSLDPVFNQDICTLVFPLLIRKSKSDSFIIARIMDLCKSFVIYPLMLKEIYLHNKKIIWNQFFQLSKTKFNEISDNQIVLNQSLLIFIAVLLKFSEIKDLGYVEDLCILSKFLIGKAVNCNVLDKNNEFLYYVGIKLVQNLTCNFLIEYEMYLGIVRPALKKEFRSKLLNALLVQHYGIIAKFIPYDKSENMNLFRLESIRSLMQFEKYEEMTIECLIQYNRYEILLILSEYYRKSLPVHEDGFVEVKNDEISKYITQKFPNFYPILLRKFVEDEILGLGRAIFKGEEQINRRNPIKDFFFEEHSGSCKHAKAFHSLLTNSELSQSEVVLESSFQDLENIKDLLLVSGLKSLDFCLHHDILLVLAYQRYFSYIVTSDNLEVFLGKLLVENATLNHMYCIAGFVLALGKQNTLYLVEARIIDYFLVKLNEIELDIFRIYGLLVGLAFFFKYLNTANSVLKRLTTRIKEIQDYQNNLLRLGSSFFFGYNFEQLKEHSGFHDLSNAFYLNVSNKTTIVEQSLVISSEIILGQGMGIFYFHYLSGVKEFKFEDMNYLKYMLNAFPENVFSNPQRLSLLKVSALFIILTKKKLPSEELRECMSHFKSSPEIELYRTFMNLKFFSCLDLSNPQSIFCSTIFSLSMQNKETWISEVKRLIVSNPMNAKETLIFYSVLRNMNDDLVQSTTVSEPPNYNRFGGTLFLRIIFDNLRDEFSDRMFESFCVESPMPPVNWSNILKSVSNAEILENFCMKQYLNSVSVQLYVYNNYQKFSFALVLKVLFFLMSRFKKRISEKHFNAIFDDFLSRNELDLESFGVEFVNLSNEYVASLDNDMILLLVEAISALSSKLKNQELSKDFEKEKKLYRLLNLLTKAILCLNPLHRLTSGYYAEFINAALMFYLKDFSQIYSIIKENLEALSFLEFLVCSQVKEVGFLKFAMNLFNILDILVVNYEERIGCLTFAVILNATMEFPIEIWKDPRSLLPILLTEITKRFQKTEFLKEWQIRVENIIEKEKSLRYLIILYKQQGFIETSEEKFLKLSNLTFFVK